MFVKLRERERRLTTRQQSMRFSHGLAAAVAAAISNEARGHWQSVVCDYITGTVRVDAAWTCDTASTRVHTIDSRQVVYKVRASL